MIPTSSEGLNKETGEAIYFYTPAFDALNNFSAHRIELFGMRFPTAEHAYQWKKFAEVNPHTLTTERETLRQAPTPKIPLVWGQGRPRTLRASAGHSTQGVGVKPKIAKQILEAGSPEDARRIARKIKSDTAGH